MNSNLFLLISLFSIVYETNGELRCYECTVSSAGQYYNETNRLCSQFDEGEQYEVSCKYSTFCMKKTYELTLQEGKSVRIEERGCAPQKYNYHKFENDKWIMENAVEKEVYQEGCFPGNQLGLKTPKSEYCYCSTNLCNGSKRSADSSILHHTDTMAVIFIFNVVKLIRSVG